MTTYGYFALIYLIVTFVGLVYNIFTDSKSYWFFVGMGILLILWIIFAGTGGVYHGNTR